MSTISRKIKKEYERASLKVLFGKNPKHRCSMCHKMALYDKENKCVHCSGKYDEQEKVYGIFKNTKC